MLSPIIIRGAEPFFIPGSRVGCLLVHGLTGAPKEMRWMGEDLASHDFSQRYLRSRAQKLRKNGPGFLP